MADNSLKVSELARFARNLENFAKTSPEEAMYHRFHGILESQIVTLQCCGVITRQGAVKLHEQMAEVIRAKRGTESPPHFVDTSERPLLARLRRCDVKTKTAPSSKRTRFQHR